MRWGVITFPGSCDDHDVIDCLKTDLGQKVKVLWHKDELAGNFDCIVLPGGFSYGDYLRCGAMARFSPIRPWLTVPQNSTKNFGRAAMPWSRRRKVKPS